MIRDVEHWDFPIYREPVRENKTKISFSRQSKMNLTRKW